MHGTTEIPVLLPVQHFFCRVDVFWWFGFAPLVRRKGGGPHVPNDYGDHFDRGEGLRR